MENRVDRRCASAIRVCALLRFACREFMHEFVRLLILCTAHYEQPITAECEANSKKTSIHSKSTLPLIIAHTFHSRFVACVSGVPGEPFYGFMPTFRPILSMICGAANISMYISFRLFRLHTFPRSLNCAFSRCWSGPFNASGTTVAG